MNFFEWGAAAGAVRDKVMQILLVSIAISVLVALTGLYLPALVLLVGVCICSTYYTMIYLESKNDRLVGGVPRATLCYRIGYALMVAGYISMGMCFLSRGSHYLLKAVATLSLVAGYFFAVYASKMVYETIPRRGLTSS